MSIKSIIEKRKKDFSEWNNQFYDRLPLSNKEIVRLENFIQSSIKEILQEVINEEAERLKDDEFTMSEEFESGHTRVVDFRLGYNQAKQDIIDKLQTIIKEL